MSLNCWCQHLYMHNCTGLCNNLPLWKLFGHLLLIVESCNNTIHNACLLRQVRMVREQYLTPPSPPPLMITWHAIINPRYPWIGAWIHVAPLVRFRSSFNTDWKRRNEKRRQNDVARKTSLRGRVGAPRGFTYANCKMAAGFGQVRKRGPGKVSLREVTR